MHAIVTDDRMQNKSLHYAVPENASVTTKGRGYRLVCENSSEKYGICRRKRTAEYDHETVEEITYPKS